MEDLNRICEIENDFEVIEEMQDPRFGTVSLMRCLGEDSIVIMRKERQSRTREEFEQDIRNIKERKQLVHDNVLAMPDFSSQIRADEKGQLFSVFGYYEFPQIDLEMEIENRLQSEGRFSPEELLRITGDMLQAMAYLQS